jgi:SPOR domain
MSAPIDTPLTGEIWHLSIDDLLAPLPARIRLGGPGPFVINLSTSSAPVSLPAKSIAGCEHAHLYQLQRTEDRRPRYRLRLGPFATEDEADAILERVRDVYPGALTATADAEDLRAIGKLQPKAPAPRPSAEKPGAQPLAGRPSVAPKPAAKPASVATAVVPPVLTAAQRLPVRPPAAKPASVATAVAPPVLTAAQRPPVRPPAAKPAAPKPSVAPPVPPPRQVRELSTRLPSLESTQTVRMLTQLEMEDEQASRWFAIQLSSAEEAFDPDTVPNLDIFSVYRLYSVAGIDQGRIVHALRLGFFSEEAAASAVASYLADFYDKPAIKRVSCAERERFAEETLEARKDIGATGRHAVIEITDERFVRERRGGHATGK